MGHHSQTKHLNLVQTQMLRPTLGMVTMVTGPTGVVTTATDMATMVTMERDLLRPSQVLKLLPVLKPRPTPGMATMDMVTDHTDMATTATDPMVMLTGDKSESQEQHPLFPADSFVK